MAEMKLVHLGPIKNMSVEIKDFMIFTGPQASGKSTAAKCIFFFKNIRRILYSLVMKRVLLNHGENPIPLRTAFVQQIQNAFQQTFGAAWNMSPEMRAFYAYTDEVYLRLSIKENADSYSICADMSTKLEQYIKEVETRFERQTEDTDLSYSRKVLDDINKFFDDDAEAIYIPAGRSMLTLLSSQLNYIYSSMDDAQKKNIDYCTQNYLERILKIKPDCTFGPKSMIYSNILSSGADIDTVLTAFDMMREILQGDYRNIGGEESLQLADGHTVRINFASSGQQEAVWILNVLFYYMLQNEKAYFIIEEPESHLFPNAQKLITEFISLAKCRSNQILMTTHSPYILGTVNNLLYADKISGVVKQDELTQIISAQKWIDFQRLSAFYFERGEIRSCLDQEFYSIENEVIDDASGEINRDYEAMVALKEKCRKE